MIFSHPAFLWGLLAVLIPVAVHLFNFRRYKRVYFSNVDRLSELQNESRRQNTVRQWLVLAMRMLAIIFAVLAFARPVAGTHTQGASLEGDVAVSIYIDNSFSMESSSADGTLLDLSREKAREIAESYGRETRYQLLTCDMRGEEMRWLSRDELEEALESIEPTAAAPLMSTAAMRQIDFLRHNSSAGRATLVAHAYLISDFQRSTADLEALPADSMVFFTLVPIAGVEADNIYIDSLRLDAPAYFAGGSVEVEVSVRNCGSVAVEKVPVKLYLDGRERAMTTLDIEANASATATLRFSIAHAGWIDGRVEVEDYPVTFDDSYHFCLLAGERIQMLEIDAHEANPHLRKLFAHDTVVEYRNERRLPATLTPYHFVVLNEVASLTTGEAEQLSKWVNEGGSLLVVPPEENGAGLNPMLAALRAPQINQWTRQPLRATTIDYSHSLYRSVFAGKNEDMELPTVQGHYTLSTQSSVQQTIVGLSDGSGMLTVSPVGQGRVYLFTLPLRGEWSDFVAQALFVPTVYNMALYSRRQPPASYTLGDSEPIMLQNHYNLEHQLPQLDNGTVRVTPDLRRAGERMVMVPHGELTTAGIYRMGEEHLAFNYPRRESELRYWTRGEVEKGVSRHKGYSVVRNSQKPLGDELRARDGGRPLWRICLLLALLALALETTILKLNTKR